jgi:hypothetical protein
MQTITYQFPIYIGALVMLLGIILFFVFAHLVKQNKSLRAKLVILSLAVMATGLFGPGLLLDRVTLNGATLTQRTGFWFAPTVTTFDLAQIDQIQLTEERGSKGRWVQIWQISYKDGSSERFNPGDLLENNEADLFPRLEALGIVVVR